MAAEAEGEDTGDALLVAGYDATVVGDPRLALFTQLGEALLASASPWRIRRLTGNGAERDAPSRGNVRREVDALLNRRAGARLLVLSAGLIRTVEGWAMVCSPAPGGFHEDTSVPLDWLALRLRRAADVPTAVVFAMLGEPRDAATCLDVLGTAAAQHLIVVHASEPLATLQGLRDGLWSEAVDLATGTVTPRSLGSYLDRRLGRAAIQPSASMHTLLAPRGLARADLAERASGRADEAVDELIGTVLPGRFRILAELGRGGFGVVYRAHQEVVDRTVAVKVLPARLDPASIRRFPIEIRAVGRLDHRNVVRVLHADVMRDGRLFVAMELLVGQTLEQVLASGPTPAPRAAALARQLIAGLAAAHAAGIIHGDVKPANVMLVDGERLVLLDFGLSRLAADDAQDGLGGTPAFMAPEQLGGARGDPSVDLYAAALVALALVLGTPPRDEADRMRGLSAFSDPVLRAALGRALAEDPAERFPSAVELAMALGQAATAVTRPPRPPFRLAAPFAEDESDDFHGRTQDIDRLLEHVLFRRAVVYVAPSGTGKTSLLRAGLLPRLRALDVDVAYIACRGGTGNAMAARIEPGAASVPEAVARRLARSPTRRLILIIDQIEAALTDGKDDTRGSELLEGLGLAAWPSDALVAVVWSVREEYLARLLDRVQRLEAGVPIVRLGPLAPSTAAEIFTRTLRDRGVAVEDAAVDVLMRDLTSAAAGLAIDLGWGDAPAVYPSHLQLAGAVLHDARDGGPIDLALYRRVGGLSTILAEHLHHVLEGELGATDTAIARDVLLALVSASHTRIACEQEELVGRVIHADPTRAPAAVIAVLEFLRDRGLLVAAASAGSEPVWDLAHDSLVSKVEAWVTSTDLARRRALELVRYHLRRSLPGVTSQLSAAELREVRAHLHANDWRELDREWQGRQGSGPAPASRLRAASTRSLRRRRVGLGAFGLGVLAIAGLFALRWRAGLEEISLRDRDIGTTELVLRAFDWDPATQAAHDRRDAALTWRLVRPANDDEDLPGAPFEAEDLSSEALTPPPGAVQRDAIAARGGAAVLVVARHGRDGSACSPITIPIRHLPGYGEHRTISVRVPSCEATLAGMIEVPKGAFVAGGVGEPPSPDQQQYGEVEREVVLPGYWLDRTELSNAALAAVSDALALAGRTPPPYPSSDEYQRAGLPDRPVTGLTWSDAAAVCRLLGKRLPTSQEWQKAVRGGSVLGTLPNPYPRRNLPWGVELDPRRANLSHGTDLEPRPAGSSPGDVGPYGHVDLAGNVSEWTSDREPNGFVVTRGGNWAETSPAKLVDFMAIENPRQPKASVYTIGVRCALDEAL